MIIYNVTVKVDWAIHEEWLRWMKEEHIPDVLSTDLFIENAIYRLMDQEELDGVTYAIQYKCQSINDLKLYQSKYAVGLQQKHQEKYKDKFIAFRTVMEQIL